MQGHTKRKPTNFKRKKMLSSYILYENQVKIKCYLTKN